MPLRDSRALCELEIIHGKHAKNARQIDINNL